jgi:hypothetical protein
MSNKIDRKLVNKMPKAKAFVKSESLLGGQFERLARWHPDKTPEALAAEIGRIIVAGTQQDSVLVDTTGVGLFVAEHLERLGVKIVRVQGIGYSTWRKF